MSDTLLKRPLVRQYLRTLDEACATLPAVRARELREMIVAHLDEALSPDASVAEIIEELGQLGSPGSIAAAAGASPARLPITRRLRNRLGRVRWWTWTAIAVLVPALGIGAGFLISMNSAAPLTAQSVGWLYPADQARAVETTADAITQTTVPIRTGQQQGLELLLLNTSDWTQVILGPAANWQPLSSTPWQVTVQTGPDLNQLGTVLSGGSSYVLLGAISPQTARWVHLTWTSACSGPGESIIDSVSLEVRVGVVTRTEDILLGNQAFALQGPSHSNCG